MSDLTIVSTVAGSARTSMNATAGEPNTKKASEYDITADAEKSPSVQSDNVWNQSETPPNSKALDNMEGLLQEMNSQLKKTTSYLKFEKDEDTGKTVFYIKNAETDEVLRQVPAEEMLRISKRISEYLESVNGQKTVAIPPGLITNQVV